MIIGDNYSATFIFISTNFAVWTHSSQLQAIMKKAKPNEISEIEPIQAPKPIILADIAARAGVAVSTVSRVMNGSTLVGAKKRKLVEAVAAEMGYMPPPMEKRKGIRKDTQPWMKHRVFKVILFGPYDSFWIINYAPIYSYALRGIENCMSSHDIKSSLGWAQTPEEFRKLLNEDGVDGFLVLNTGGDPLPREIDSFPAVAFMGYRDGNVCDRVLPDNERTGALAAEYLHSKGCELSVAIGGKTPVYERRIRAFRSYLTEKGVTPVGISHASIELGGSRMHQANKAAVREALRGVLADHRKPIGIFCVADIVTPVVYAVIAEAGLRVGHDVHVISCNNERPYLDPLDPEPAVIDTRASYIGSRAVRQLMSRLECPSDPYVKILVEPQLILSDER
jgi:LacI family transcriptional regulator